MQPDPGGTDGASPKGLPPGPASLPDPLPDGFFQSASPEQLTAALTHPDRVVRRRAAVALAAFGPGAASALAALRSALWQPNWPVREAAAAAIGAIDSHGTHTCPLLRDRALHDPRPEVRDSAGRALALARWGAEALPELGAALKHRHASIRRRAARALSHLAGSEPDAAAALLHPALADGHARVRAAVAAALGVCGQPALRSLPALVRRAYEHDKRVRAEAARAALRLVGEAPELGWLVDAGFASLGPEEVLAHGLRVEARSIIRTAFACSCQRRADWHQRRPRPKGLPLYTVTDDLWGLATAAAAAAAARGGERAGEAEWAWLLGRWCGLLLGDPDESPKAP